MTNRLSEFRGIVNVTQVDLGNELGVTSDYISIIERGKQNPGFKLAKKIADYFTAKLQYIVTVDDIFFPQSSNESFDSMAS